MNEALAILLGILVWVWWLYRLGVSMANALFPLKLGEAQQKVVLPSISVLVPIRNEMGRLPALIDNLSQLKAPVLEILIFDDASDDGSTDFLREASNKDLKLQCFSSDVLPEGWLGKNHACWQLASRAKGDWLLFLDADVRLFPSLPAHALEYALRERLDLLSIFPEQKHGSWGEALWVPLVNHVLLSVLYLPWVKNCRFSSMAAANGQFMLFNKEAYFQSGGHAKVAEKLPEDILLARQLKKTGGRAGVLPPQAALTCRMYAGGLEAFLGLMRNVVPALGGSRTALAIIFSYTAGILALCFFTPAWMRWGLLLPFMSRIFVLFAAERRPWRQLILVLPQLLIWQAFWPAAVIAYQTKLLRWKDRPVN